MTAEAPATELYGVSFFPKWKGITCHIWKISEQKIPSRQIQSSTV